MSSNGITREQQLERFGRYYGQQHFAVAFTHTISGDHAKEVKTTGWQNTMPLADPEYAAGLIKNRGKTRNPAIVLRPSGLIGIECDSEDDLARIAALNLPETVTVRSSADYKRHFYYRPDPTLEALPYVAFRFETGKLTADSSRYFVAPPALHPLGEVYSFLPGHGPDEIPIAVLDADVYKQLAAAARHDSSDEREQIRVDPDARIRAGRRRTMLFKYACMLRRWGLSRAEIAAQTHAYNLARCEPPVPDHLVEVQIDGAMRKEGGQELAYAEANPLPDTPDPPPIVEAPRDSWEPIDLNTLPDTPPVKPTLAGPVGIVYPGKRHVFSGAPESAKTLAAYAILIEVVRNNATACLIDFEMGGYDARTRLRELGATPNEIRRVHYLEPDEPANPERITRLIKLNPRLVVIDASAGAYDLQGLDDNKRADVERLSHLYAGAFWRNQIATILIDHVVKDRETRGRYAIGSERKLGGADVHLGFETIAPISRGGTGRYKVVTHKDRGGFLQRGHLGDLELTSDPDTHEITTVFTPAGASDDFRPTHLMEKVSIHLELQSEPLTRNAVADAIGGTRKWVFEAITALVNDNFAAETEGPRRSKLVRSIRRYRENDPDCNPETTTQKRVVLSGSPLVREPVVVTGTGGSPPLRGDPQVPVHSDQSEDPHWFGDQTTLETTLHGEGRLEYLERFVPDEDDT